MPLIVAVILAYLIIALWDYIIWVAAISLFIIIGIVVNALLLPPKKDERRPQGWLPPDGQKEFPYPTPRTSGGRVTVVPASPEKTVNGGVYLIRCGDYYKIGKTNNFDRRIGQIALQMPHKVEVVHKIYTDDFNRQEKYWHQRFASKRMNGEWFKLTEADIKTFQQNSR